VGQAYGAASAILSALALTGVATSLLLQGRQTRLMQSQTIRGMHADLLRMAAENSHAYWPVLAGQDGEPLQVKRQAFAVMLINHFRLGFEVGLVPEEPLRNEVLPDVFAGEIGRRYWEGARSSWSRVSSSRQDVKFLRIVEQEYEKAVAAGPAIMANTQDAPLSPRPSHPAFYRQVAGFAAGTALSAALATRRRSRAGDA